MNYKLINNLSGWMVFLLATFVYVTTIEPTTSFWDTGEFIATAYKLEIGHPPGAPLFMLIGRFFSAFVSPEYAAAAVNILSALCSSFTILFLFWTITAFGRKLALRTGEMSTSKLIAIMGSGAIGGLAFTFSDSFWFSAVEGEVYAMSSLFTAVVFWAIMKWDALEDRNHETRWLVFIAYMMGLSIGVHLLNLLTIPAIALVFYFRNYQPTIKGVASALVISVFMLGFIQWMIIPGVMKLAGGFEVFFTNSLGMPFNSGSVYFGLLTVAFIALSLYHSQFPKPKTALVIYGILGAFLLPLIFSGYLSVMAKFTTALFVGALVYAIHRVKQPDAVLNTAILSIMAILIGYSTFATILIRSSENPPMDENNPENVMTLLSYLNREQYGSAPLLYGPYYSAPIDLENPRKDGSPTWIKAYLVKDGNQQVKSFNDQWFAKQFKAENSDKNYTIESQYIISDPKKDAEYNYNPQFKGVFPRMYSTQQHHITEYEKWSQFKGTPVRARGNDGTMQVIHKPTFTENIRFFTSYQINWMYWRYFMWNFAGRQNDVQGHGSIVDGNWLSGVKAIDKERLGNQDHLPPTITENKAYNRYYLLPLILGVIGLVYQFARHRNDAFIVTMLFLLTGLAIVVYLNQTPMQPRERDYAYAGSFYAFAIWIGLGVYALFDIARNITMRELQRVGVVALGAGILFFVLESFGDSYALSFTMLYIAVVGLLAALLMFFLGKAVKNSTVAAVAAVLIALPVPVLMGAEGWDDHNRSHRYTARDFAINYLESCEPNAIIFTNGDNDTFPLWYAQEVEGVRTDVRVCNLSLLNTDWYVDQMKRKAYESEPLPISIYEEDYRQGTRDIVYLDPSRNPNEIFVSTSQAVQFALQKDNVLRLSGGEQIHYMPTKTFSLPVDSARVMELGVVRPEQADEIVSAVEWRINRSYLLKNQFIVLDILANNNWERPIYYAGNTGPDSYLGLQNYFQLEGLAYRLVPVKAQKSTNPNLTGQIHPDKMYDVLMNKFRWGGMDSDREIYLDENNMRMITNLRMQFSNLADELITLGREDEAQEVLMKALEVMPEHNVPYNRVMLPITESLYKINEDEIANEIAVKLFDRYAAEMNYYLSLDAKYAQTLQQDMQIGMYVMQRLETLVNTIYPQDEQIGNAFTEQFNEFQARFETAIEEIELRKMRSSKARF